MAYTFWSVVFGEQPSASKWNILGTNDAGFKDGTNIDSLAITNAKANFTFTTGTNAGNAGGTTNRINLGGMKLQWGITNQLSFPATANTQYQVTFPEAFIARPALLATPEANTGVGELTPFLISSPTTTTAQIALANSNAAAGTAKIDWFAIGN